jgi:inorganic pyrophosphatase/exopolyphosphatase
MIIITSGQAFVDVDTLASALAYKELMDKIGKESLVVLPGPLNESVSANVRKWKFNYQTNLPERNKSLQFIMVDVSDPKQFAYFVQKESIVKLFDHHLIGFEKYWREKLGNKSVIEEIGACATLIWEEFKKNKFDTNIQPTSANLLYTAILSNTLNLQASVTTGRDIKAIQEIIKYTHLPQNWEKQYFDEVSASILANPIRAMKNDTKLQEINGKEFAMIQIELWDSFEFIELFQDDIIKVLSSFSQEYAFFTSPSISEGKNYIIALDEKTKNILQRSIPIHFEGLIGTTKKLFLRKEIIKKLLTKKI